MALAGHTDSFANTIKGTKPLQRRAVVDVIML
jgi:hypothetical protein